MGIRERKEREKQLRKQQILKATKNVFMRKGFKATTMEDIAQKAELSPATIYNYFNNKEELYVSLNLIFLQYLVEQIEKVYNNNVLSVEEKILKFKEAMFNTFQYDPGMLSIIFHVQTEDTLSFLTDEMIDQLNYLTKKVLNMIADIYEEGVGQGKFLEGHGMALADIIWSIFTGIVLFEEAKRKINPEKDFLKTTLDKAFDIFCKGIKKGK